MQGNRNDRGTVVFAQRLPGWMTRLMSLDSGLRSQALWSLLRMGHNGAPKSHGGNSRQDEFRGVPHRHIVMRFHVARTVTFVKDLSEQSSRGPTGGVFWCHDALA